MRQLVKYIWSKEALIGSLFGLIALLISVFLSDALSDRGEKKIPTIDEIVTGQVNVPSMQIPSYRECFDPTITNYLVSIKSDIWIQNTPDSHTSSDAESIMEVEFMEVKHEGEGGESFALTTNLSDGELWHIDVGYYLEKDNRLWEVNMRSNERFDVRICEKVSSETV